MARKPVNYTSLGERIAKLAHSQDEIARVLELTQQSISGKLRGEIAISLEDLRTLSDHYNVPMTYFFMSQDITPELLNAWDKILAGPEEVQQALVMASSLPREFTIQLWQIVRAMHDTSKELNRGEAPSAGASKTDSRLF